MDLYGNLKRGEKGAWLSIGAYLILSVIKLIVGVTSGSEALKADGLNNVTDIIASVAVLIGLKVSRKPADHNHHYGHLRAESIASFIAALIMAGVAIQVFIQAGSILFSDTAHEAPGILAGGTAIGSAIVMLAVYRYNIQLAGKIKSSSLYAAAQDNRSDALVSLGAAAGIFGSMVGLTWLDPLAALIVGIIIMKTAAGIFKDAVHALTDGFDENKIRELTAIAMNTPGVNKVRDIRGRSHGNLVLIDLVIKVKPDLNVVESHDITEEIEAAIRKRYPHSEVLIHIEPDLKGLSH